MEAGEQATGQVPQATTKVIKFNVPFLLYELENNIMIIYLGPYLDH